MNRYFYFFTAIFSIYFQLVYTEIDEVITIPCKNQQSFTKGRIEFRSSVFVPTSDRASRIYGNSIPNYAIEITRLRPGSFDYWMNFNWLTSRGSSVRYRDSMRINIASLSLGLKRSYPYCQTNDFYWGLGAVVSGVQVKRHSQYKHETGSRASFGGVFKLGTTISIGPCSYFNLFTDYYVQPWVYKANVNMSGLRVGLGLGINI